MDSSTMVEWMKAYRDWMRKAVANRKKPQLNASDIEWKQSLQSRKKQFKANGAIMRNDRIQSNIPKVNALWQKRVEWLWRTN